MASTAAVTAAVAAMAAMLPIAASAAPAPRAHVTASASHARTAALAAPGARPRPARLTASARGGGAQAGTCAALFTRLRMQLRMHPRRHPRTFMCLKHGLSTRAPGFRAASFLPIPSWCGNYPAGTWWYYRTDACLINPWSFTIWRLNDDGTRTQVGWFSFWELSYSYTSSSINTWGQQMQIQVTGSGGDTDGLMIQGDASCTDQCTLNNVDFAPQPALTGQPGGTASFNTTATDPGAVGTSYTTMSWWFTKPGAIDSVHIPSNPPQVRCDNNMPGIGPGCVFGGYMPVMVYSLSGPYPQLAQHISDAQSSGLPGAYPNGTPLSRLTDDTLRQYNRDTACPDSYPRPDGDSCDEYPFASTWQGAWTGGGNPRTFDWCQVSPPQPWSTGSSGYSVCMIDATQNSSGGLALGNFYNANRVMDGDNFQVWITS
jgi:hypothetical protein